MFILFCGEETVSLRVIEVLEQQGGEEDEILLLDLFRLEPDSLIMRPIQLEVLGGSFREEDKAARMEFRGVVIKIRELSKDPDRNDKLGLTLAQDALLRRLALLDLATRTLPLTDILGDDILSTSDEDKLVAAADQGSRDMDFLHQDV